jgi:hypothetical protein
MSGYLRPAAVNFLDEDGDVDLLAFKIAKENYKRKKEEDEIQERADSKKTRPYSRRNRLPKIDPKLSSWWTRYVLDENKTWRDVNHRDGKLFALRFSFDFDSVQELTAKISEPKHNFWRDDHDAAGKILQSFSIIFFLCTIQYSRLFSLCLISFFRIFQCLIICVLLCI